MDQKRTITDDEKKYLLSLRHNDITKSLLQDLFAYKYDIKTKKRIKPKFNTYDEFVLNPGESFNKSKITTNCGLYIVNMFLYERFKSFLDYVNVALSKKEEKKVRAKIDAALLEDRITKEEYIDYLNDDLWFKFTMNTEIVTSLTIKSMKELPAVKKAKEQKKKEYKDKLEKRDVPTATKMEKELLDIAREELKDDPSMELYDSGARGGFDSAYKCAQIMNGAVYNESTGQYDIMTNSLMNGIDKSDIVTLANSAIIGQYSKSISPGECGYMTKKINAAFQGVVLDKPGSDCGSKGYMEVVLNDNNAEFYSYMYMVQGNKLVRLEPSNLSNYMGKKVKFRSAEYCTSKCLCNKCAGDLYYMLEIKNIGLTISKISNKLLNARMKQFHDPVVKTSEIDPISDFS